MSVFQTSVVTPEFLQNVAQKLKDKHFAQAQETVLSVLSHNPMHPQLWVFLAESLEHQNQPVDAWAAYNRAWILDPAAAWAPIAEQRLRPFQSATCSDWMERLLTVPTVTVSAALIVKDEAKTIVSVIEQLKKAVDEVVVVDTGSTDNTMLLADKAGATVYQYAWDDSFAAARNFALQRVTSDWVLFVDGDEVLNEADVTVPRVVAGLFNAQIPPFIVRVVQVNHIAGRTDPNYDMSRLFPTRFGLKWWGRIHEQVGPAEGGVYSTLYTRPVVRIRLDHHGYEPDVMTAKRKLERNIALLQKTVEEDPGDVAAWGFVGREYYFSALFEEAVRTLYRTEDLSRAVPTYGRLPEVRTYLTEALLRLDRLEEARQVARRMIEETPQFPGGWYLRGRVELAMGVKMLEQAQTSFAEAKNRAPQYRGLVSYDATIPSYRAVVGMADAAKLLGRWTDAIALYQQASTVLATPEVETQLRYLSEEASRVVGRLQARTQNGSSVH